MSLFYDSRKPPKYAQPNRPPKVRKVFLNEKLGLDGSSERRDIVYNNCRGIHTALRLMGAFPFARLEPGVTHFKIGSPQMAYAAGIFITLTCYVLNVVINRINVVRSLDGRFEEAMIAYLFLLNLLPIIIIPVLWYELNNVVQLLNDFSDFEVLYYKVTERDLPLKISKRAMIVAIALPIFSSISVIVTHVTLIDFRISQIIPYCYLDSLIYMMGAYWYFTCNTVSSAALILADDLQKALRYIGPAAKVSHYRALWLRLSKLCQDIGSSTCYTYTFISLYIFFIITLSIYGLMAKFSDGFSIKDIGLCITGVCSVGLLYFICNEAHYAATHVKTNFQKKLLMVELSWMNIDAQSEIKMFLRGTEMNPESINLGGFFDVNRTLFKSLLTTIVTYLIVLLQFQISLPEEPDTANSTQLQIILPII